MSVMTGEKPFKTEIEACDFTRHDSIEIGSHMVSQHTDIDVTYRVSLYRATLRVVLQYHGT